MKFRVKVIKENGAVEDRVVEAPSRLEVYKLVEADGTKVRSIEEGSGFHLPHIRNIAIGRPVNRQEVIVMAKNLSAMLSAGLALSRALSVIERQSANPRLRAIIADIEESVRAGSSFHEALGSHRNVFSDLFIAMMRAGEESGSLAGALTNASIQMDRTESLERKIRGAMIYPAIVLFAIIVVSILMMIFVVPTLTATFNQLGVKVPLATRVITEISNFMVANIALVLAGLIAAIVGFVAFSRSLPGRRTILTVALHLPVIGELVKETYAARVSRTLASLLSSGVPVIEALSIGQEMVGKTQFGRVIEEAQHAVEKGTAVSAVFAAHSNLFPLLMSDMLAVGEETGTSADMLKKVAEFYEEDVEQRTKDLSTIIEPVLMLVIGAAVGVFAVSMIAPIYSLSAAVN